jgi:hypothetical protein
MTSTERVRRHRRAAKPEMKAAEPAPSRQGIQWEFDDPDSFLFAEVGDDASMYVDTDGCGAFFWSILRDADNADGCITVAKGETTSLVAAMAAAEAAAFERDLERKMVP